MDAPIQEVTKEGWKRRNSQGYDGHFQFGRKKDLVETTGLTKKRWTHPHGRKSRNGFSNIWYASKRIVLEEMGEEVGSGKTPEAIRKSVSRRCCKLDAFQYGLGSNVTK